MIRKIWDALSILDDRIMKLAGSSIAGKVAIRFLLNVALFIVGFYVFTGILWVLAHLVPQDLAQDPKFNRVAPAVVGSVGAAYVLIGIWCVFGNANRFRKALKNKGPIVEGEKHNPA